MNLKTINEKFLNDFSAAFDWLQELGLLFDRTGLCPECLKGKIALLDAPVQDGKRWRCLNRKCRKTWGFRRESWFEGSHLSIPKILELTYLWVYEHPNKSISQEIGVSVKTVIEWANACRDVCLYAVVNANQGKPIGGVGRIVEIDQCVFRGCKFIRRDVFSHKQGSCLFGGIDQTSKEYFFTILSDFSPSSLIPLLQKHVKPGTTIITNSSKGKSSLPDFDVSLLQDLGYLHQSVEFSAKSDTDGGTCQASAIPLNDYGKRRHQHNSFFIEYVVREHFLKNAADPFLAFIKLITEAYGHASKADDPSNLDHSLMDHSYANAD